MCGGGYAFNCHSNPGGPLAVGIGPSISGTSDPRHDEEQARWLRKAAAERRRQSVSHSQGLREFDDVDEGGR